MFSLPFKKSSSMMKHASTHSAPTLFMRFAAAVAVPPVAIRSSMRSTFAGWPVSQQPFSPKASKCTSTSSNPYSRLYFSATVM